MSIFHILLTHIYITTTVDVDVVARGITTIVPVSDFDAAIRVDLNGSAVEIVVWVVLAEIETTQRSYPATYWFEREPTAVFCFQVEPFYQVSLSFAIHVESWLSFPVQVNLIDLLQQSAICQ